MTLIAMSLCGSTFASSRHDFNLIVAPARFSVMQVMFDVISQRPSVLVSYQENKNSAEPLLHVWNGASWNQISLHDLRELSFVQKTPKRAILIGDDELLPVSVKDSLSWMPELVIIRQLDNASLLNEFGRITSWNRSEWAWFSTRYNLQLEDETAALRDSSWYDQPGPLIKDSQPSYEPVPYIIEGESLDASGADQTSLEPVARPSDIRETMVIEETVVEVGTDDEIKEIVETLEMSTREVPNEK